MGDLIVHPACTVRVAKDTIYAWCATTYTHEYIADGSLLVVLSDVGYHRVLCLDNGRVYHVTHDRYRHTDDIEMSP